VVHLVEGDLAWRKAQRRNSIRDFEESIILSSSIKLVESPGFISASFFVDQVNSERLTVVLAIPVLVEVVVAGAIKDPVIGSLVINERTASKAESGEVGKNHRSVGRRGNAADFVLTIVHTVLGLASVISNVGSEVVFTVPLAHSVNALFALGVIIEPSDDVSAMVAFGIAAINAHGSSKLLGPDWLAGILSTHTSESNESEYQQSGFHFDARRRKRER